MHTHGYFGPESITWKIGQESILLLGGARAVLMQLAHPLVAMGVSEHSSYMTNPFKRTEHTFLLGQMLTFGTTTTARQAARTINSLHKHVHGTLSAEAGAYSKDTPYCARDPKLLLWVHATLADTILRIYPLFVGPLTHDEQNQYYQESKTMGYLLGLTEGDMPSTVDDLYAYVQNMVYSNQLAATPQARQLVRQVLYPPIPDVLRPILHFNLYVTSALLPQPVRELYGLEWSTKRQQVFDLAAIGIRNTYPHLPDGLRVLPITRRMMRKQEEIRKQVVWHPVSGMQHW